jgi:hypothetical protein
MSTGSALAYVATQLTAGVVAVLFVRHTLKHSAVSDSEQA